NFEILTNSSEFCDKDIFDAIIIFMFNIHDYRILKLCGIKDYTLSGGIKIGVYSDVRDYYFRFDDMKTTESIKISSKYYMYIAKLEIYSSSLSIKSASTNSYDKYQIIDSIKYLNKNIGFIERCEYLMDNFISIYSKSYIEYIKDVYDVDSNIEIIMCENDKCIEISKFNIPELVKYSILQDYGCELNYMDLDIIDSGTYGSVYEYEDGVLKTTLGENYTIRSCL